MPTKHDMVLDCRRSGMQKDAFLGVTLGGLGLAAKTLLPTLLTAGAFGIPAYLDWRTNKAQGEKFLADRKKRTQAIRNKLKQQGSSVSLYPEAPEGSADWYQNMPYTLGGAGIGGTAGALFNKLTGSNGWLAPMAGATLGGYLGNQSGREIWEGFKDWTGWGSGGGGNGGGDGGGKTTSASYAHQGSETKMAKDYRERRLDSVETFLDHASEDDGDGVATPGFAGSDPWRGLKMAALRKEAKIRKRSCTDSDGNKGNWVVESESGKQLGCHASREDAVNHLQAIEANKSAGVIDEMRVPTLKWREKDGSLGDPKVKVTPNPKDRGRLGHIAHSLISTPGGRLLLGLGGGGAAGSIGSLITGGDAGDVGKAGLGGAGAGLLSALGLNAMRGEDAPSRTYTLDEDTGPGDLWAILKYIDANTKR